jgi:type I restriction enzyme M protein
MASDLTEISNTLWSTADKLRANSGIMAAEYARPVLGLLSLRHADERSDAVGALTAARLANQRQRRGDQIGYPGRRRR